MVRYVSGTGESQARLLQSCPLVVHHLGVQALVGRQMATSSMLAVEAARLTSIRYTS